MRIFRALTVSGFIALSACQPSDSKVENPNAFNKDSNSGFNSLGRSEVSHEDMFQYALTRLHQGLLYVRTKPSDNSCVKIVPLSQTAKSLSTSYTYNDCNLGGGAQSDDLLILGDRGVFDITVTKVDETKGATMDNIETVSLVTRVPLEITMNPSKGSGRKGTSILTEELYLQLAKIKDTNQFHFIFSVQGKLFEHVISSKWESRTNGEQSVYFRGVLNYDLEKKALDKVYVRDLVLKDIRPKIAKSTERVKRGETVKTREFNQVVNINLKYDAIDGKDVPPLVLEVNEQDCWILSGQGLLKKISSGFINHTDKKENSKSNAGVVLFDLNKDQLALGPKVSKWPSCDKSAALTPRVAYGAVFIK